MKNLAISSLLLLLALGCATAQNFAPVGAKWHYSAGGFIGPQIGFFSFESVLDTLIDGQECRRIAGSTGCFEISEYVFDRNDSVFFYHSAREEFCLLYDFGASVGDTWTVYHVFGDSSVVLVDSLGTREVDGHTLRTVHTSSVHTGDIYFWGTFTERIGGVFPVIGFCDPSPDELRCYEDSVISLQQGPYDCEEVIPSVQAMSSNDIRVYPNPFADYLKIDLPAMWEIVGYVVSTADGRAVMKGELDGSSLNLGHLPHGMYMLNLICGNQSFHFKFFKS